MNFLNEHHQQAFIDFLEEGYLEKEKNLNNNLKAYDEVLKRQLGFLYILAFYQEDYKRYEGETFYIEGIEDLEIGGPVYLLEKEVILREEYPHEKMITFAKAILKGEILESKSLTEVEEKLYEKALHIADLK